MIVKNPEQIRILSIDGGGARGLIAVRILQWIEELAGKPISDLFDFIAGTSTGGLISCGLTARDIHGKHIMSLQEIESLYTDEIEKIFPPNHFPQNLFSWFYPRYSPDGLTSLLAKYFDDKVTLNSCNPHIQIAAYDIANDETIFFKTRYARENEGRQVHSKVNAKLSDVCLATSAAPTYFKPHKFTYCGNGAGAQNYDVSCIDGGTFVNNPSLATLAEIRNHTMYYCDCPDEIPLNNFYCLSIGTGDFSKYLEHYNSTLWGKIQWAEPAINIMMKGVNQTTDYQMAQLLGSNNYLRINPTLDTSLGKLDETKAKVRTQWLREVRDRVIENSALEKDIVSFLQYLQ